VSGNRLLWWRCGVFAAFLLAWETAGYVSPGVEFSLARPTLVAASVIDLCRGGVILRHIAVTGGAALIGMVAGTLVGAALGLLTWFSRSTALVLRPFVIALGALPILAVAPMMIIWFGIGLQMKIALASLSTVFVAFSHSSRGAEKVSNSYIEVLRGVNATGRQIFLKVVVPGSLDWVFSSMRLNAGLALLGTFIGEFIASDRGLGHLILRASSLYDIPRALAASLFIVLLALAFDGFGAFVEARRNSIIKVVCIPPRIW
jgi:NitT/TauT family transport system permease protein